MKERNRKIIAAADAYALAMGEVEQIEARRQELRRVDLELGDQRRALDREHDDAQQVVRVAECDLAAAALGR